MAKKKPPGRPAGPSMKSLHLKIPEDLRDFLEVYAQEDRRTITAVVLLAIEKYFRDLGRWPLPPKGKE